LNKTLLGSFDSFVIIIIEEEEGKLKTKKHQSLSLKLNGEIKSSFFWKRRSTIHENIDVYQEIKKWLQ